jgi:hypothetical protein
MLGELGFKLPRQAILYNVEAREFNARKFGGAFGGGEREVAVPALKLEDLATSFQLGKTKETFEPHPIRTSLGVLSKSSAKKDSLDVRIRSPRPVYHVKTVLDAQAAASIAAGMAPGGWAGALHGFATWTRSARMVADDRAVFLVTREECWNEENPFIVKNKPPTFAPTKDDDPKKGTLEETRRGPFPIAAAVEAAIPETWLGKDDARAAKSRVAVIGSGGVFVGPDLAPMQAKLLLDVSNWLVGRDDQLARDAATWHFPRVQMERDERNLWRYGAVLVLPLAFVYVGMIVWLARRMR